MSDQKGELDAARAETLSESAKADHVEEPASLDEGELFLRANNISDAGLQSLLLDAAHVKRLVRKIDARVLPLLAGTYVLQYIDKQALGYAAVFDLFSDTGISQTQYSWFASIFYLAYLVAEYPWTALAQRTRMAKVVSGCVIAWGAVLAATAACGNFAGLAACRFLLGVFEAPITPCFMMIVSMWVSSAYTDLGPSIEAPYLQRNEGTPLTFCSIRVKSSRSARGCSTAAMAWAP